MLAATLVLGSLSFLVSGAPDLKPPLRVLVLPFDMVGFDAMLGQELSRVAAVEVARVAGRKAILPSDIAATFTYQTQRILAGCQDEPACIADVGAGLAADKLLTGRVARVGTHSLVTLTLIDVQRMDVETRRLEETEPKEDALPAVIRKVTSAVMNGGPAQRTAVLPQLDSPLTAVPEGDAPDIVVDTEGVSVAGAPCFELLPSGRIPGEVAGSGMVLPLFGCVLRDRHRMHSEPLVAVDRAASTSLVLRVLYTLGRAEFGAVRMAARSTGGGTGSFRITLPSSQVVGCKEKWSGYADGSIPVSLIVADEGLYVGAPGALLPGPGGPGVNGPTLPVLPTGQLDLAGLGALLEKVRKAWPRSYFVVTPSSRLGWADGASVMASAAAQQAAVLVGTGVTREKSAGAKVEVRVITSRPPQAAGEQEVEFPPGLVMRGGTSGFTLQTRE